MHFLNGGPSRCRLPPSVFGKPPVNWNWKTFPKLAILHGESDGYYGWELEMEKRHVEGRKMSPLFNLHMTCLCLNHTLLLFASSMNKTDIHTSSESDGAKYPLTGERTFSPHSKNLFHWVRVKLYCEKCIETSMNQVRNKAIAEAIVMPPSTLSQDMLMWSPMWSDSDSIYFYSFTVYMYITVLSYSCHRQPDTSKYMTGWQS